MSTLMMAQMGLNIASAWAGFQDASVEARMQRALQSYQNNMARIGANRQTDAVTVNEARTRDAGVRAEEMIQRTAIKDQARAQVSAAAAGVKGNSVELAMADLRASASRASYAQRRQVNEQLGELGEQKKSIALNTIMGENIQVIPKPSVGSALLGLGTKLLQTYDSHQPEGDRIFGYNGGRVNDTGFL